MNESQLVIYTHDTQSLPGLLAPCLVYESAPCGASAGSCGLDFAVGTSYSLVRTMQRSGRASDSQRQRPHSDRHERLLCGQIAESVVPELSRFLSGKILKEAAM